LADRLGKMEHAMAIRLSPCDWTVVDLVLPLRELFAGLGE